MGTEQEIKTDGAAKYPAPKKKIADYFRWWNDPTDRFALFLVVVTFLLFIATAGLYYATKELVEDAKHNAQRQLRAYVLIERASVTMVGRTLVAALDLKNFGQTPAYDATTVFRLETRTTGERFSSAPLTSIGNKSILGPGVVTNPQAELPIPADNAVIIPNLQKGDATVYLVGKVEYRDAFDKHWILDIRMQSLQYDGSHWRMHNSEDGNRETEKH